jgi:hypothetical protein
MILRLLLTFWRPIAALLAGFGLYAKGRADATAKAELASAKATVLAENLRKELDDDLETETDLVARARRNGSFVRPDVKP